MLIALPPQNLPQVLCGTKLTDKTGWIPVDAKTLRTEIPNVFAVGDITNIVGAGGLHLPKTGVVAADQGEVVAGIIAAELGLYTFTNEYAGDYYSFLEIGNSRAAYMSGNLFSGTGLVFHEPNVTYHWGKVVFEKYWLWRWF